MESVDNYPAPSANQIAFSNQSGDNNCFMNCVFQLFFNIAEIKECLDAVVFTEPKDSIGEELKTLIQKYNHYGLDKPTIKYDDLTKTIYANTFGDKFTINIKRFRKEFSKTFPSVSKMGETGDAMSFWSILIQIVNSLIITESSIEVTAPKDLKSKDSSMIYEKLGIQYLISEDSDDFEITPYFQTFINVSILEVISVVHSEFWNTKECNNKIVSKNTDDGTDLNSLLECNKYEIFAMLLPEYIALSDVFDRNTDNSSEDSDDETDKNMKEEQMNNCYQLSGMVLYTFGHYFAAVYNQDIKAWVIYDDNFVASKKSVVKDNQPTDYIPNCSLSKYLIASKCIPMILCYTKDNS